MKRVTDSRIFCILFVLCWVLYAEGANVNADVGPRLTDEEFFTGLNIDTPGLDKPKVAVRNEDWQTARGEFARYIRILDKVPSGLLLPIGFI